jgi:hypothetical protein
MSDPEQQTVSRRHQWTMTHGFWAAMGGIAIDTTTADCFSSHRCTLTAKGVSFLLKHNPDSLPDIAEDDVKDKSKGSSFSKFVACIQTAWFCLSCIARISDRLPLSMLELNTFAHALCTVVVYILWWKKPLDIEQPLLIRNESLNPLLAYMWMSSNTSCILKSENVAFSVGRDPEFEAIIDCRATTESERLVTQIDHSYNRARQSNPTQGSTNEATFRVTTTQIHPSTGFCVNDKSTRWTTRETKYSYSGSSYPLVTHYDYHQPAVFNLTPYDVRRWELAREAMDKYSLSKPSKNLDLVTIKPISESMDKEDNEAPKTWQTLGFALLAASYGGLHMLAWNLHFPTSLEQGLWRISVLVIASPAVLWIVGFLLLRVGMWLIMVLSVCFRKLPDKFKPSRQPRTDTILVRHIKDGCSIIRSVFIGVGKVLGPEAFLWIYLPARAYLVVESLRTLFALPAEAYKATSWSQYIPHIT